MNSGMLQERNIVPEGSKLNSKMFFLKLIVHETFDSRLQMISKINGCLGHPTFLLRLWFMLRTYQQAVYRPRS
jgi:hypothetical protein